MKNTFAVCIDNQGYETSLERGKIYRVIGDHKAKSHGYIRVVDETGEDYGYASERFFPIEVPDTLKRLLKLPPANKSLQRTPPRATRFARRPAARR